MDLLRCQIFGFDIWFLDQSEKNLLYSIFILAFPGPRTSLTQPDGKFLNQSWAISLSSKQLSSSPLASLSLQNIRQDAVFFACQLGLLEIIFALISSGGFNEAST